MGVGVGIDMETSSAAAFADETERSVAVRSKWDTTRTPSAVLAVCGDVIVGVQRPNTTFNPDECVGVGAALQSFASTREKRPAPKRLGVGVSARGQNRARTKGHFVRLGNATGAGTRRRNRLSRIFCKHWSSTSSVSRGACPLRS